jgi:hypothetical protein
MSRLLSGALHAHTQIGEPTALTPYVTVLRLVGALLPSKNEYIARVGGLMGKQLSGQVPDVLLDGSGWQRFWPFELLWMDTTTTPICGGGRLDGYQY